MASARAFELRSPSSVTSLARCSWRSRSSPGSCAAGRERARAADYVPGEVVVGYAPREAASVSADIATVAEHRHGVREHGVGATRASAGCCALPRDVSGRGGDRAAAPISPASPTRCRTTSPTSRRGPALVPNDPGRAHARGAGSRLQWNFLAGTGVNAPQAWANLIADHRPGGQGRGRRGARHRRRVPQLAPFRRVADFAARDFVDPVRLRRASNRYPLDREGHGTFVAGDDRRGDQQRLRAHRPRLRRDDHARPGARRERQRRRLDDRAGASATRSGTAPR